MIAKLAAAAEHSALIDALNGDLAAEYQAVLMYNTYAAEVTGVERVSLAGFFRGEIADEFGHAQFLADKIAALGGRPTSVPEAVPPADGHRAMLERVRAAEEEAVGRYTERMKQAEEVGDFGLADSLQAMIADETRHMEEADKLLRA